MLSFKEILKIKTVSRPTIYEWSYSERTRVTEVVHRVKEQGGKSFYIVFITRICIRDKKVNLVMLVRNRGGKMTLMRIVPEVTEDATI